MMSNLRKRLSESSGFTLVELIVVIAVLGILAGIAVPRLTGVQDKAKLSEAKTALGTIREAVEMYNIEESGYPSAVDDLTGTGNYIDDASLPDDNWNFEITTDGLSNLDYEIKATGAGTDEYPDTLKITIDSAGKFKDDATGNFEDSSNGSDDQNNGNENTD